MENFENIMAAQHNAEAHAKEIETSRVGGFGGSDAKLFLNIARKGVARLSKTDTDRIAQALGIIEYKSSPDNQYTRAGHKFEDAVDEMLRESADDVQRETVISAELAKNFKTFAHADFTRNDERTVYECKFYAKKTTDETAAEVMAQLQWYYMLGAQRVLLVHGMGDVEPEMVIRDIVARPIERNEGMIDELRAGVSILDKAISDGWQPTTKETVDVPAEGVATWDAYLAALDEIAKIKAELDPLVEMADKYKDALQQLMSEKQIGSMSRTTLGVTHTCTLTNVAGRRTFDDKKFLAAHPEFALAEYYKQAKYSQRFTFK